MEIHPEVTSGEPEGASGQAGPVTTKRLNGSQWVNALEQFSDPDNYVAMTAVVFVLMFYVTMVYGPIAAYLVELFPAKVRYTSLSVPYHFGNGWFGGGIPFIATALVTAFGGGDNTVDYQGLWYPIIIALMTVVIGSIFLKETYHVRIWDEVTGEPATTSRPAEVDVRDGAVPQAPSRS